MHTNYVISLTTATQRREHIRQEFGRHNISFEFYDALVPSEYLNQLIQTHLPNLSQSKLSEGEKACFMSHYMLWKKCIDEKLPYIYIFEDDVLLGEDAYSFLEEDEWLKERFDVDEKFVLRFETHLMPIKTNLKKREEYKNFYKNRNIVLLEGVHFGTASYIINFYAATIFCKLFKSISTNEMKPLDVLMFDIFLNNSEISIYQLNPALCVQDTIINKNKANLNSMIIRNNKPKESINFRERIYRLITKPKRIKAKKLAKKTIIPFK
ncbi:hypothetical protein BKG95_07150 [Rodentibacter pneumotropicus]|uniref:Glycosyltransferase family 25 protein n=1 Tax=Rodentibacter pneumotropicus TaxID=758 RepID=A0AAW5LIA4_9PAST|nr:glycosyltransferase family 25 protein [Rodentibacter pneumotropicus]MCQ9122356.1 glycosyltransferase family 25 protein [Rodentibacter pneumotropicus]OOF67501.1 hypothetical protein BKG95_07150 [Rodentibacter pneumotropicus]